MADMVRLAGLDVSKDKLDVYVTPSGESRTVGYDRQGLAGLRRWLVGLGVALVALEASGGYEREVSEVLEEAGLIVHRLNPLRVRRFAQLKGRLAKTDRLDARTIAEFARAWPQEHQLRRDPRRERLAEHLLVRRHTQKPSSTASTSSSTCATAGCADWWRPAKPRWSGRLPSSIAAWPS